MELYDNDHDIAPAPGCARDVAAESEATISRVSRYEGFLPNDLDVRPHLRSQSFGKAFVRLSEGARLAGKRTLLFSADGRAEHRSLWRQARAPDYLMRNPRLPFEPPL